MINNNGRNMLEIANAKIAFTNFAGREKTAIVKGRQKVVNDEGKRNFVVNLDPTISDIYWNGEKVDNPDFGQELANIGFNVSVRPPHDDEDRPQYRLPVAVSYDGGITPKIFMIANGKKTMLDGDSVAALDGADIMKADIVINNGRPYENNDGRTMVKAWCNEGYFTVAVSRFASDYDDD